MLLPLPNTPEQVGGCVCQSISYRCRKTLFSEREALTIVWKWRLRLYLYSHFKLITDCKPVQLIFSNPKLKSSSCIERWNLRLQGYDFEIVHTEGSQNPSDILSRHSSLNYNDKQGTLSRRVCRFSRISCCSKS